MKKMSKVLILLLLSVSVCAQTDLSDLHAPPTQAEIDAVKAEWATRDHGVYNWTVVSTLTMGGGAFNVDIVSHEVGGNVHYAAVRYPENYDPTESYPVLIFNHGGASGVNVAALGQFQATCYRSFFVGLPSFRSEELRTGNLTNPPEIYTSGGVQSEMDGDTDDALSLLTGILALPGADANRVGVLGGSRGGGVSHLMSAKDDRIQRASIFYGATDHMTLPGLQAKMEDYVDNGGGLKPPEAAVYTYGVAPYLDGTLTLAEARLELLRRSVVYFVDELPLPYLVQHSDDDLVVTVNHSQLLAAEFAATGISSPDFEYFEYTGYGHTLPAASGAPALQENFLCQLNNLVLPVELLTFAGTCQERLLRISLEWSALIDNSAGQFAVQRSADGRNWRTVKTIDITESPNHLANYIYHDTGYQGGANYYRLRETDRDGRVTLHRAIQVTCGADALRLFPQPSDGTLTALTDTSLSAYYPESVEVFDLNGKVVHFEQLGRSSREVIDLTHLPAGIYTGVFKAGNLRMRKRVVLR